MTKLEKDLKYSESNRSTVPPQETTVKVPIQSLIQIEFKKINTANLNMKLKNYFAPNFKKR